MPEGAAGGERRGQNTSQPSALLTAGDSGQLPREGERAVGSQSHGGDRPGLRAAHTRTSTPPPSQLRSAKDPHLPMKSRRR